MNKIYYDESKNEFIVPKGVKIGVANLMWHLTGKCNLLCDHCFSTKSSNSFDIARIESYIKLFKEIGVKKIDLSGGEPLLYEDLAKVCHLLKTNGIPFTITTSAFVEDDKLNWLISNAFTFSRIILSINAPTAFLHENINHRLGSFEKIIGLAKNLKRINAPLRINTVCTERVCEIEIVQKFVEIINDISPLEWCIIQEYGNNNEVTQKIFDIFLQHLNSQKVLPCIKIINRTISLYSDYYVLDEKGYLFSRGCESNKVLIEDLNIKKFLEENTNE